MQNFSFITRSQLSVDSSEDSFKAVISKVEVNPLCCAQQHDCVELSNCIFCNANKYNNFTDE